MRRRLFMIVLLCVIAVSAPAGIVSYFRDRGADFLDIFLFRISAPRGARGIGFRARATALAQVGAVYFEGEHFGIDRRGIGVWEEHRKQGGISLLSFSSVENEIIWGNYFLKPDTPWMRFQERGLIRNDIYWDDGRKQFFSINAEVQPSILPGLEIGIYPVEILDFAVGFLTLDPQNDDLARVQKYAPEFEEKETTPTMELKELPADFETLKKSTVPLSHEPGKFHSMTNKAESPVEPLKTMTDMQGKKPEEKKPESPVEPAKAIKPKSETPPAPVGQPVPTPSKNLPASSTPATKEKS